MLIPIELNENYTYYLNLTKVNGLTLIDRTKEEGYVPEWHLYLDKYIYKSYKTKEEALKEIDRINKISGKILKIWKENS